jgi:PKD repeat protein
MSKNLVLRIFISLCIVSIALVSCKKTLDIVPAPTVSFTSSDKGDGNYQFNINSTNATSYMWDFGDNEFSDEASPLHFYMDNGTYTVKVTAKGEGGTSNYNSTPSCESSGTATFTGLKEGTHTFTAKEIRTNPKTWSSTVIIRGGNCSKMELAY